VQILYEYRTCADGNSEVRIVNMYWDTDVTATSGPCYLLHADYGGARSYGFTYSREAFVRKMFQLSLLTITTKIFNQVYTLDSLSALAFPNNPLIQATLHSHECPNGSTQYRAVLAQCMMGLTKYDTLSWIYGGKAQRDDKQGDGASIAAAAGGVSPWVIRTRLRWVPCSEDEATYCCLHKLVICRNPITGQNTSTYTAIPYGGEPECPEEADPNYITPHLDNYETAGKCLFYCVEGEGSRIEQGDGRDDVPSISNR
jgi:hypothetical protein